MPDVLRHPLDDAPRRLDGPAAQLDPISDRLVRARVAAAEARAYDRGVADGQAGERARLGDLVQQIEAAVTGVHDEVRAQRRDAVRVSLALVDETVRAILDATPPPAADELLGRIVDAVASLADEPLTVRLSPANAETLREALGEHGLSTVVDASLADGDAVVAGPHTGVALTRSALLDAARAILKERYT